MIDEPSPNADDQALSWLIRVHSGEMSRTERREFALWLRASDAHRRAYAQAEALWDDAGNLNQDPVSGRIGPALKAKKASPGIRVRLFALGAMVSAGLFIVFALGLQWHVLADQVSGIAPQIVILEDGSRLYLDAETALSIQLTEHERRIVLHRGACWFRVAADPTRPFRVVNGDLSLTALGTEFLLDLRNNAPYVAVTEHAVQIEQAHHPLRIDQGEGLRIATNPDQWRVEKPDLARLNGFRDGLLIVENRPLSEVVSALSRYRHGYLIVQDPRLAQERISGVFDLRHPENALAALREILPIDMIRLSPYLILILPS